MSSIVRGGEGSCSCFLAKPIVLSMSEKVRLELCVAFAGGRLMCMGMKAA